jgi:hypothetical protein
MIYTGRKLIHPKGMLLKIRAGWLPPCAFASFAKTLTERCSAVAG